MPEQAPGEGDQPAGLAVFQEPTTAPAHSVDPRDAWMLFVRQSDKGVNGKRRSKGKARRPKVSSLGPSPLVCTTHLRDHTPGAGMQRKYRPGLGAWR